MLLPRKAIVRWLKLKSLLKGNGYRGNYPNWEQAKSASTGYADPAIFETITHSARLARDGKAAYERDGVAFYEEEVSEELLRALQYALLHAAGKLRVVDFGGGLGSFYFKHRKFVEENNIPWFVVEQGEVVAIGQKEFEVGNLRFVSSLEALPPFDGHTFYLLGCVLPYLERPYDILEKILLQKGHFLFIDKHPLIEKENDRLTVQHVPPSIYRASYPAWFFSRKRFQSVMQPHALIFRFVCPEIVNIDALFEGFFYRIA